MSSRLTANGRHVVVTTPSPGLHVGDVYRVIGNTLLCSTVDAPGLFAMLGEVTGRRRLDGDAPDPDARRAARPAGGTSTKWPVELAQQARELHAQG